MFHLLLISSLFVSAFSGLVPAHHLSPARGGRIIGGDLAKPEDFPYQAEVYTSDVTQRFYLCGGAILSENVIITAASCILRAPADEWYVHVGSNLALEDGQTVSGRKIVYHNLYNDWTQDYDIALLFLYRTLAIDDETIKPIALPTQGQVIPDGTLAATCGWGKRSGGVSSFRLYNVTLAVVNQAQCVAAFNPFNWLVSDRMLCASRSETGNDVDSGDVGGPLVANDVLIGITSWGYNYVRASYPGVWTRVPSFVTWITTNMIET